MQKSNLQNFKNDFFFKVQCLAENCQASILIVTEFINLEKVKKFYKTCWERFFVGATNLSL